MSEIVAEGIIEARRLIDFAQTFAAKPTGVDNPLVSECRMHFSEHGIHVAVVDPANVAMVNPGDLAPEAFEHYKAPGEVTIGVNLERLIEYVKPADAGAPVNIAIDMETRHLLIEYGETELSMGLIDPDSIRSEPDIADLDLPNIATLTGEQFDHALTVADLVSDHVRVAVDTDAETLAFTTRGDIDEGGVEYDADDLIDTAFMEDTEALFSLDYLRTMAKPMPEDGEIELRCGHEYPIKMSWSTFDGAFSVSQMVAPRIQSD